MGQGRTLGLEQGGLENLGLIGFRGLGLEFIPGLLIELVPGPQATHGFAARASGIVCLRMRTA